MMGNFVINSPETKISVSPKTIDGDISYWLGLIETAYRQHTKMRVVATDDGGVKIEFYSPWEIREALPTPVVAVEKKSWWNTLRSWGKFSL